MPRSSSSQERSGRHHGSDRRSNVSDSVRQLDSGLEETPRDSRVGRSHRPTRRNEYGNRDRDDRGRRDEALSDDTRDEYRKPRGDRRYRERSRSPKRLNHRRRSRSSSAKRQIRSHSRSRSPPSGKSRGPLPSQDESFHGQLAQTGPPGERPPEKQKPNFKPTGLLAKEANTVAGSTTVLKYHEPPEARKPPAKEQWRLYIFKKKDLLDTVYLYQKSAWLMGRDQKVTDFHLEHPSISKQHAVIQFRHSTTTNEYGDKKSRVKPYLIDLESANGTKLNGRQIETSRFVELVDQDVVAFGESEREYVLMLPE